MKLVFASSLSHDTLKRHFFLGTLCDAWELIELRFLNKGSGDYRCTDWNNIIAQRACMMRDLIHAHMGEIVVFSDVDIQWFRPAQDSIVRALDDCDIVFQREHPANPEANVGFFAVRCTTATEDFLAEVAARAAGGQIDQDAANELIAQGRMPCRYGFLPPTFYNRNLGEPPHNMILYHSIGTIPHPQKTSVQLKLELHLAMRAEVLQTSRILREIGGTVIPPSSVPRRIRARRVRQ